MSSNLSHALTSKWVQFFNNLPNIFIFPFDNTPRPINTLLPLNPYSAIFYILGFNSHIFYISYWFIFVQPMSKALNLFNLTICYLVWKVILEWPRFKYSNVLLNLDTLDINKSDTHSQPFKSKETKFLSFPTFYSAIVCEN